MDLTLRNFSIVIIFVMPLGKNFKALVHSPGVPSHPVSRVTRRGCAARRPVRPIPLCRIAAGGPATSAFASRNDSFRINSPLSACCSGSVRTENGIPARPMAVDICDTIEFFLPQRHRRQQQPAEMRTLGRGLSLRTDRPGRARAARKSDRAEPVKAMSQPWVHFRLIRHGAAQTNRCPDPPAAGSGQLT